MIVPSGILALVDRSIRLLLLTQGKIAVIDAADYLLVSQLRWFALRDHNTWYAVSTTHPQVKLHQWLMDTYGPVHVHHRNGNGLDNRRCNLQIISAAHHARQHRTGQPGANCGKKTGKTSQYRQVAWDKHKMRWQVIIWHNGKSHNVGRFRSEIEAAHAADAYILQHGLNRPLNFPAMASDRASVSSPPSGRAATCPSGGAGAGPGARR